MAGIERQIFKLTANEQTKGEVQMIKITWLSHSCFEITDGKYRVLTDPFFKGNSLAKVKPENVKADFILVSHCHGDHIGDTATIAQHNKATVCGVAELVGALQGLGIKKLLLGNLGGWLPTPFGRIKIVPAIHGSGLTGALACGFIVEIGGKKVYFAGDTALFGDMALIGDEGLDCALIPIGDFYTMGPADALKAAKLLRAKTVVPMHYDTFPVIRQNPHDFAASCSKEGINVKVLNIGETIEIA